MLNKDAFLAVLKSMKDNDISEVIVDKDRVEIRRSIVNNTNMGNQLCQQVEKVVPQIQVSLPEKVTTTEVAVDTKEVKTEEVIHEIKSDCSNFEITAPIPGTIFLGIEGKDSDGNQLPKVGDRVNRGQAVACIEAMKMFIDILAEKDLILKETKVGNGQSVEMGDLILVAEEV